MKHKNKIQNKSNLVIRGLASLGLLLSAYALYVEYRVQISPNFVALCDLGRASCSKVLTSSGGHLFGVPNASLGLLFYFGVFMYTILTKFPARHYLYFTATSLSVAMSCYLAFLLHSMGDLCILCIFTYIINFMLWLTSLTTLRSNKSSPRRD